MLRFSFPGRRVLAGAFCVLPLLISAATLRVPEDYALIQRAIAAAAPADTIVIAAGTYRENLFINKPLTLRGAGSDKTTILAPNRSLAIARIEYYGPVTLTDLTLAHEKQSTAKEPDVAVYSLDVDDADITLRNLHLARSAGYGIHCVANAVVIENVTVSETAFNALSLEDTKPGVRVTNLVMNADTENNPLRLENVVGTFKDVKFSLPDHGEIQIWGAASAIKFENLPPAHFARIRWLDGAAADGPKPATADSLTEHRLAERTDMRAMRKENIAEKNEMDVKRAAAAREFATTLKTASTPEANKAAVTQYIRTLVEIDGVDFNWSSNALPILGELSAYSDRFGPLALEELLRELPAKDAEPGMADNYLLYLPAALKNPIAEARAKKSLASTFDLPAVLAKWKSADGKDPRAAATAFADVVKTVSEKADASSADEKQILKSAVIAEISPFIESRGYAALSALIDALAANPLALVSADEVRAAMSPTQKRALAKHLLSE
ncbi:hypothetical protein CMV30_18485 [Nibricoccus aquaticus]|uniref:Right handed beta helix domain-containing protein n=1 Tax=Nibricoccus aquaticus TaxID=2576891 RepID=A0A290QB72_9BACT|nr:hypothetical protein [Nibricoccus aquaticus]ATC65774.1 hypothetical protein CMV30_18485 [Nibricoccus aquaticus]